jgi:hypothetical protein
VGEGSCMYLDLMHTPSVPRYFAAASGRNWRVSRRPFKNCPADNGTVPVPCQSQAISRNLPLWDGRSPGRLDSCWATTLFSEACAGCDR